MYRRLVLCISCFVLILLLAACALSGNPDRDTMPVFDPTPIITPPPTPSAEVLHTLGIADRGPRLRVTVPSVELPNLSPGARAQVLVVLADPRGKYAYVLAPSRLANASGNRFELSGYPLEISLHEDTGAAALWFLAVDNRDSRAAELFGMEALAASLGLGFQKWLASGDPIDDPLAAVVAASDGALYDWFASIAVVGQSVVTLGEEDWNTPVASHTSPDQGLNAVYTPRYIAGEAVAVQAPTPQDEFPGYTLLAEENFNQSDSIYTWYQGQDSTYINRIFDGAYEIRLSEIVDREFSLSWGSIEDRKFADYIVQAEVQLVEDDVQEARYGIWFNYQDDYNFMYFGISNQGQYRAAVIVRNANRIELQDWTTHPVVRRGAATNTLTIQSSTSGDAILSINGVQVAVVNDETFTSGSIAFFCYAESVPATCRLERLRIWERTE